MDDPTDDMPRNISWGEWRDLKERVTALEAKLAPKAELVPVALPVTTVRTTRGTRIPEGWVPRTETIRKMCDELRVDSIALGRAHLKFMDYFMSVPGQKGVKMDWDRTWCNWMRTESERGTLSTARSGTVADKVQGWMELGNARSH